RRVLFRSRSRGRKFPRPDHRRPAAPGRHAGPAGAEPVLAPADALLAIALDLARRAGAGMPDPSCRQEAGMGGLILLRPWWLVALLPLLLLVLWILRRTPDAGGWQRVMPRPMLQAMIALEALGGRQPAWQRMLAPFAIFALILGLTGPALPRRDAPV